MIMTVSELTAYYSANYKSLVKRIYRNCGNYHDAEDVVQEAFERAVKYINTCKDPDKWFYTILRNTYRDYISKIKSWPVTKPLEDHVDEVSPIEWGGLDEVIIMKIYKLVQEENEPNKTILQLNLQFGYTSGEINQIMSGMTAKKIDNIISYFKRKLIKSMQ